MQAIKTMELVKRYKNLTAVDKLHLEIQQGELFSLLGVNGAGKSSLINRLSGGKKAKVENRPGVTLAPQWVSTSLGLDLMDMPGILWPKFDDQEVALQLAYTGAIKDDVIDIESLALSLTEFLKNNYPDSLLQRYKLKDLEGNVVEKIARARGMMVSGGELDTERAAIAIIDEFRSGKLGKISLEKP